MQDAFALDLWRSIVGKLLIYLLALFAEVIISIQHFTCIQINKTKNTIKLIKTSCPVEGNNTALDSTIYKLQQFSTKKLFKLVEHSFQGANLL